MRIPFVVLIWVVLVGGLSLYMRHRDAHTPVAGAGVTLNLAEGRYALEVTPTFAAESDPFALASDTGDSPAVAVRMRGREIVRAGDAIRPGVPIRVDDVQGFVAGDNEVLVEASPPSDDAERRHFVHVRILRDGLPVAEETFWSEGGARVSGALRFSLREGTEDEHGH